MFLFQIFLHQEVKRNQNITKGLLLRAPCRNPQPSKDYFSFRHFLASSSYFQTLRVSSLSSLPVVHFLKQCVILLKERSSGRSFIFLTVLASLRGSARAIHSIIQGDFFYQSGCIHLFFQGLYRTDNFQQQLLIKILINTATC